MVMTQHTSPPSQPSTDGPLPAQAAALLARIHDRSATIGIIGLGYVGLPLVLTFTAAGFKVRGFDIDADKVTRLNAGESYIRHIAAADIAAARAAGQFEATTDFDTLDFTDAVLVCVPTPLTKQRDPDLSFVTRTVATAAPRLRRGTLLVLESTTYPGTTDEVLAGLLHEAGLTPGDDLYLAYSPEREDPNNAHHSTGTIPKVVGADDDAARALAVALYGTITKVVPVSSARTAEAVKLTENIFRSVNIALVNELKIVFGRMGIDIWEVVDAAKTKPFGYMPFYPGPGLGGHCIPIDPFYLSWKVREYGMSTRFIELAGEINSAMPDYVVRQVIEALNGRAGKSVSGSRLLLMGLAYKRDVDDMRESPALVLLEQLEARGATVEYYDPYIPVLPPTREHPDLAGRRSVAWDLAAFEGYDAVLIATDHTGVDYAGLVAHAKLIVDTRNAARPHDPSGGVVSA